MGWQPLREGWVIPPGPAGAGGILRDATRSWLCGFVHNIGIATSMIAELWGYARDCRWPGNGVTVVYLLRLTPDTVTTA